VKKKLSILSIILMVFLLAGCSTIFDQDLPEEAKRTIPGIDLENADFHSERVLVRYASVDELEAALSPYESSIVRDWERIRWAMVTVPEDYDVVNFIKEMESKEAVFYAEPDFKLEIPPIYDDIHKIMDEPGTVSALDLEAEDYDKLWGMANINAPAAWEMTTGCEDVVVAIIDTGVQYSTPEIHPEFVDQEFVAPFNATGDDHFYGANDIQGHGTHVAGTAVADGRSGKLAGVAWDTPIMPIRVMDLNGDIWTEYTINAFNHIMDYLDNNSGKRVVVNYSIGGRGYSYALNDVLEKAADEYGVLMVTSAGNSTKRVLSFPAGYNSTLSVAALTPTDTKADFSTTGWWNSVAAPGVATLSADIFSEYSYKQGTSMAAPHVTGAVALLLSVYPDLTPIEIINQVEQTAREGAYGSGFTEELGYGILDVEALLGEIEPMEYGAIEVKSDVVYGLIAIFDADGNMVSFGATGDNYNRIFPAIKPGTYTVTLSFMGTVVEDVVNVTADERTAVELMIND